MQHLHLPLKSSESTWALGIAKEGAESTITVRTSPIQKIFILLNICCSKLLDHGDYPPTAGQ